MGLRQAPRLGIGSAAAIAFFAAFVVVVSGGWQIMRAHRSAFSDAGQRVKTLTRSLSQHAARTFEGVDLVLSGVVERVEDNADREHLKSYLEGRLNHVAQIRDFVVLDAQGRWIADTFPFHPVMDSKDRDYFVWHRDHPSRDLHIGEPTSSPFDGKKTIPLSRRLDASDGSFAGVVYAEVRSEVLQSFYRSLNMGSKGAISLVDPATHVIARYPGLAANANPDPARMSQITKTLQAPSGISRSVSAYDGIDRIFAFEHVEGYPLIVATAVAVDETVAHWRREALIEGLVLGIAAVVLVTLGIGLEERRRRALGDEAAARDINRQYRLLTENSTDLIALKPSFRGHRAYVSPSCRAVVGWEPEELAVLPNERFIHPDDLDRVAKEFAALTPETPRVTSLHRCRHKGGHYLWLEVVFHLTGWGTPAQSVVVAARDVTARHEAQQALIESEARYRLLADASSDMIQRLDLEGRRRYVSPASMEIFGLDPPDMMGTHPVDFIHPEDADRVGAMIEDVVSGRRDQTRSIHRIRHKDGHWVWVETQFRLVRDKASGAPLEIVSNLRDVTEREVLQRRLREANHSLLMTEEIAHVGHWRIDLVTNELTWSDEVYRIHGMDPATYKPTVETAIDLYHPEDRAEVARCVNDAVERRIGYEFTLRVMRPDGGTRHVLSRGLCEVDRRTGTVAAIFGAIMDVTDLAQAERDVREKSSLLETTLDNMDQALIKVAADGTIELANRRFAALLDIPPALLDKPRPNFEDVLDHLVNSGEYQRTDPAFQTYVAARGAPFTLGTYERSRPNGTVLEVRTVATPGGGIVRTYADITARRQAEAAMREGETKYRVLAESTNDVITRLGLDFKREYVSPACKRVLGYEPEEMLGVRPSASIHPEEAEAVRALAARLVAGEVEGDRVVTTYRAKHKDGHWVWLEAGINLVRDEASGAPICLTCTIRDVTERQRTARHLERARAAAEEAAMAKADFLANMSHELRTPLAGILGIHDLIRIDPALSAEQHRLISLASEAGRSLLAIVNDILDFSKIEAGQLTIENVPFAIEPLLKSCCALAAEGLDGRPVRLETRLASLPEWLVGDPNRLRQILLNLLTNAVKFTERGVIRVSVVYDEATGRLRVEVIDTGIGVAPEKLPVLFSRFSQADASTTRRYGGTGLGLVISKRLAELMAGTIGVESVVGIGSTFWFELPLGVSARSAPKEKVEAGPLRAEKKVLLAEDNQVNQEIIASMLSHRGYAVTTVADGAAAVEAMVTPNRFDLILMDLQMPVMDGLTATARIRAASGPASAPAAIPIVGLTANAMAGDIERCLAAGMNAHVAKPIEWSALFAIMERLIEEAATKGGRLEEPGKEADVLDERTLEDLSREIGRAHLSTMLRQFQQDLDRRLEALNTMTPPVLAEQVHSLASVAGQLGFVSLSRLCMTIEAEARRNGGLERVEELRDAAERAAEAARTCRFAAAA